MDRLLIDLIFALAGGLLYRWRGMSSDKKKYFPRPFNQIAFALPYALIVIPAEPNAWLWAAAILTLTLATLAVLTGHGQYDMTPDYDTLEAERVDFIPRLFFGRDPRDLKNPSNRYIAPGVAESIIRARISAYGADKLRRRNVTGMATKGAAITLTAGLFTLNPFLAFSGALLGPAYWIAWRLTGRTELGEFLGGFFLWGSLAALT